MIVLVLALSLLIGISLGLLGGGGSILTVPILTGVAGFADKPAIAASLFVVGTTSAVAVIQHARAGRVRWRTGLLFGGAGMIGAYLGGRVAKFIPAQVLMLMFAAMMLVTAIAMLRGRREHAPRAGDLPVGKVLLEGAVVGAVTGIVGAGGGFLVVPALVLLGGLPMQAAVGTSLLVIAMKSYAGLAGHLAHVSIDWSVTLAVTGVAVVGSLLGARLVTRVRPEVLRRGFGWFVIVMAIYILARQIA
ncbi:MAG: sulfite exporter TauE/SafE family protein [Kofleriaceae bacterium]|nr:sulfite exporter TauE/SafE family protein [Kofleriaceae bacterium]MBP6841497.1 sulfite exporter TauE/SafE family protein [Kofleriaceae bacterium]MBP9204009.1 sulfite exporter TauE/SafE family protein [Kofleriaceae bacterium]